MPDESAAGPPATPNVLLIVTDDQRYDGLQVMDRTRHIFQESGTKFRSAYATTPLCCPSRATILSGQYAHNHGVRDNKEPIELDMERTWPVALDDAGYRTALFGKYLNNYTSKAPPPGFDKYFLPRRKDANAEADLANRALRFAGNANAPWAIYLAPHSPHEPWNPAAEFEDADVGPYPRTPAQRETNYSDKPIRDAYDDDDVHHEKSPPTIWRGQRRELLGVDAMVDRIFEELPAAEAENTLAIYTSDNGFLVGEHGLTRKSWPYLNSVRVPLLATGPGISADGLSDELVANVDIAPTIYEVTGTSPLVTQDGNSLLSSEDREWLLLEGPLSQPFSAYLSADREYARWPTGEVEDYDLNADPWQLHASNAADAVVEQALDAAETCAGIACP